jgi:hypothetical protein
MPAGKVFVAGLLAACLFDVTSSVVQRRRHAVSKYDVLRSDLQGRRQYGRNGGKVGMETATEPGIIE